LYFLLNNKHNYKDMDHYRTAQADARTFDSAVKELKSTGDPLSTSADLDVLMARIGDARIVLLGEASHGTHEFYTWRTAISQRLIKEKGFNFIAVEGDWPDCYRINRFAKGYIEPGSGIVDVLKNFNRWPTWMWANWEVAALAEWLKGYNNSLPLNKRIGFYGLDVYSLNESLEAIMDYLHKKDPEAAEKARKAVDCFESYGGEMSDYARSTLYIPANCEDEVVEMLREIRSKVPEYDTDPETTFSTEQNALIAVNAEKYYRAMVRTGAESWNIRDRHMVETLNRLLEYHGKEAKAIVWEHNTHIGDARAMDMYDGGMVNVGQLLREENAFEDVVALGFGTYNGKVIAATGWSMPMKEMSMPDARPGSWEEALHEAYEGENRLLIMEDLLKSDNFDHHWRHRAIGVVYHPSREQYGNYVPSIMPQRYDAFIHIDTTSALHPLHLKADSHQTPETYPWGY
jgi:erythromycin esterase